MIRYTIHADKSLRYYQVFAICAINANFAYALQRTIPSVRGTFTPSSLLRNYSKCRNINRLSISIGLRLSLRPRLTLIRLTLIRKPWSFGGEGFHLPYRYLCLHLLFHPLQNTSQYSFGAEWNAPLPVHNLMLPHGFGNMLDARLLSVHSRSTSELLRTL